MPLAKQMATDELTKMGAMSTVEKIVAVVFCGALLLWATSGVHHISATTVGMLAVVVMLLTNVLTWDDVLNEKGA